jgi:uncharacterized membrane protein
MKNVLTIHFWVLINILATSLIILVIMLHVWFLVLEMFLWTKPLGLKLMAIKANHAEETKHPAIIALKLAA